MNKKTGYYFYASLLFALWFALTSAFWTYFINLFISFPFGILSFYLARKGASVDTNANRYKIIRILLIAGVAVSLISLIILLIYN
ncbi:MAG TPA: hypothetical protein VNB90_00205 [Cytophagaceae bacterium]|nr:hypothetical protein [Cytophagaceae bacterium]